MVLVRLEKKVKSGLNASYALTHIFGVEYNGGRVYEDPHTTLKPSDYLKIDKLIKMEKLKKE